MRTIFLMFFLLPVQGICQTDSVFHFSGEVRLNNLGFAPVPAFSFNDPIVMVNVSAAYGRFSFAPDLSVGLNGKPWLANYRFGYQVLQNENMQLNIGANPFFYYYEIIEPAAVVHTAVQRNLNLDLRGSYQIGKNRSLHLLYMNVHGFDPGSLSGHFVSLGAGIENIPLGGFARMAVRPELFFFDFDGNTDGFFANGVLKMTHTKIPLALNFQAVQRIVTNFEVKRFNWNAGISIEFDRFFHKQ